MPGESILWFIKQYLYENPSDVLDGFDLMLESFLNVHFKYETLIIKSFIISSGYDSQHVLQCFLI